MWRKTALVLFIVGLAGVASLSSLAQQPIGISLHALALTNGGKFVLKYKANRSTIYPNIAELANRSDLIVVGKTIGHRSSLRADGKFITEDYFVKVQELLKGSLSTNRLPNGTSPSNRSILVSLPGGAYRFADGAIAAVLPVGEKAAEDGHVYVFFLKAKLPVSVYNGYLLASETQGLFALTNGVVDPADAVVNDPVVVKYHGMRAADFLREIHKAIPPITPGGGIIP